MNRLGIKHENHDGAQFEGISDHKNTPRPPPKHDFKDSTVSEKVRKDTYTFSSEYDSKDDNIESPDEALSELLKRLQREPSSNFYKNQQNSTTKENPSSSKTQKQEQKTDSEDSEVFRILRSRDPYEIFGISKNVTATEIKSRYRELAKKHNPSQGIINKSDSEKERSNKIMAKINYAFGHLKQIHREGI